jgi:protease-4
MDVSPSSEGHPQSPIIPQVVREPWPPARPRRGFFGRLLLSLFLLVFVGSILLNLMLLGWAAMNAAEGDSRIQEKYVSHNRRATDKVAVISVEGVILEAEDGFVKRQIDRVMDDKNVKAVVLRVDSPGGSVSGSDYIYHHLRTMLEKRKIPMVVSMGSIAASGGYYVSMAVGHEPGTIFAEPTAFTGSIGVIIPHYELAGLMEKIGAKDDSIMSNPLKGMGGVARPMTKDERHIFQNLVDESFTHFKDIVKSGRSKFDKDSAALDKLATGQVFTAEQAKKDGLIDSLGFIEDAVDQAIKLAKLDKDEVRVVRYKPEPTLANLFMGGQSQGRAELDLRAILDMTSPRAYYLCTWLPAVAGSAKQ